MKFSLLPQSVGLLKLILDGVFVFVFVVVAVAAAAAQYSRERTLLTVL